MPGIAMPRATPAEGRVLLEDVRWETYQRLLEDFGERRLRHAYDRGSLELVTPSFRHEWYRRLVERLIDVLSEELGMPVRSGGSTRLVRPDLARAVEPDSCYWVGALPELRGGSQPDAPADPPPDLVLESECSRSLLPRLPILTALGVAEVWRFDGADLGIWLLDVSGRYEPSERSRCFPGIDASLLRRQLTEVPEGDETPWIRSFRVLLRAIPRAGHEG